MLLLASVGLALASASVRATTHKKSRRKLEMAALHLHCKRNKIFRKHDGDRELVVRCTRDQVTKVPDWVKQDPGYAMGLKDKSIVDLTPPKGGAVKEIGQFAPDKETAKRAVQFLASRGYTFPNTDAAVDFVNRMDNDHREGFLAELKAFTAEPKETKPKFDDNGKDPADSLDDADQTGDDQTNVEGKQLESDAPVDGEAAEVAESMKSPSSRRGAKSAVPKGLQGGTSTVKVK
jgi:hypothetical protein